MHRLLLPLLLSCVAISAAPPQFIEDRFEVPAGFRIYRAAGPELTGGSYAMTFDGQGRLLVGDGNAVRRLKDQDNDGVFDSFEVIATGLGPRGPQGLLAYGDNLYAVGGDGLQLFTGYNSGEPLVHRERLGHPLRTGGDHDAHTILCGHDGWIYLMAGNGSGLTNRTHINQTSSPALKEREASVFRISPDGQKWECLASGGRNPPSLGLHPLGDFFSFDSDMEWHVGLPFYRPVRLNHWLLGGDQGWHDVGALPPYFIDTLTPVLEVGRGSPNWGIFYEHSQLPAKYRDAFLACDYRWKMESNDQYASSGRLVAFHLTREGAGWKATMETLVKPKPGAVDAEGKPISFALVDVAVAPDGSLVLSDHNQGIWRVVFQQNGATALPPLNPLWTALPTDKTALLTQLLRLDQPGSERTRLREGAIRQLLGIEASPALAKASLENKRPLPERIRAIHLLAPEYAGLSGDFIAKLASDHAPEIRAQAAWLFGLRSNEKQDLLRLTRMLADKDPFVRRRAAEALNRTDSPSASDALIERLGDKERLVRHAAMTALAHRPTTNWFASAARESDPQIRMRALTAAWLRGELPNDDAVRRVVRSLLAKELQVVEDRLDLLRVLELCRPQIEADNELRAEAISRTLGNFPDMDRDIRWEQVRFAGNYRATNTFPRLLRNLETEKDPVTQFHIAQSLAVLSSGWTPEEEKRALDWMLSTQTGWFAEFSGKGVQFPEFWNTVLADFAGHHRSAFIAATPRIQLSSLAGAVLLQMLAENSPSGESLIALYRTNENHQVRLRILTALRPLKSSQVAAFLGEEHDRLDQESQEDLALLGAILLAWADRPDNETRPYLAYEGLFHQDIQVARAAARALTKDPERLRSLLTTVNVTRTAKGRQSVRTPQSEFAEDLLTRMIERNDVMPALERVLMAWSNKQRPDFKPGSDPNRRLDDVTRTNAITFWKGWYKEQFRQDFVLFSDTAAERSDAEVHRFLMSDPLSGGNSLRGVKVYETLQCQTCHGGGVTPGREGRFFGPDLAGVTRRLTRAELADSLVFPSKQVADRFKAVEVTLKDSTALTGFLTEQTAEGITLADREQVHRIARNKVESISPLSTSLMPERLLNRLSWEELRDLYAFLEGGLAVSRPKAGSETAPNTPR